MSLESLRKDFPAKYGYCPCVVETFVDPEQDLAGICCRASSWDELGLTSGRGRNAADWKPNRNRKLIFLYTLAPGFREKFGFQPLYPKWNHPLFSRKGALAVDSPVSLAEWPALEYGACSMGHDDRNRRAAIIAQDIGRAVDRPYPDAAGGDRNRINAYYFTESGQEKVSFDSILSGTVECTWRRAMGTDLVRILQDGTVLNLDGLQKLDGLGVAGKNQTETLVRGLHLHTGLASDRQGRRLGVGGSRKRECRRGARLPKTGRPGSGSRMRRSTTSTHRGCRTRRSSWSATGSATFRATTTQSRSSGTSEAWCAPATTAGLPANTFRCSSPCRDRRSPARSPSTSRGRAKSSGIRAPGPERQERPEGPCWKSGTPSPDQSSAGKAGRASSGAAVPLRHREVQRPAPQKRGGDRLEAADESSRELLRGCRRRRGALRRAVEDRGVAPHPQARMPG